jgi:hypothetical protein
MWVSLVYLAGGDQKDGSFRGEATKTAAEVPKYRRNPPAATRIGLAIWRIPVMLGSSGECGLIQVTEVIG